MYTAVRTLRTNRAPRSPTRSPKLPFSMPLPTFSAPPLPLRRPRHTHQPRRTPTCAHTTVLIVPTGIGASIGGYAGDALPTARLLSSVTDTLITHPNVLNGALLYYPLPNALYVEGHALDAFAAASLSLHPPRAANTVGLLLDSSLSRASITRHLQAADAARATLGLRVPHYTLTDAPLNVHLTAPTQTLPSNGTLENPASLLRAARRLAAHVDAIAVVARFPDDEDEHALEAYRAGSGVDAVAGAEAVISHLVTRELQMPCAHAPALPPLPPDDAVAPKAAAEELGYTFLSCVLVGLSRAPRLRSRGMGGLGAARGEGERERERERERGVCVEDVDAVVVPADAFGGAAVMSLAARPGVLVVAVKSNRTVLEVPPEAVGIDPGRVVWAESYAEAAGFLAAQKAGIDLAALTETVPRIAEI